MKTGIIVYVAGNNELESDVDLEKEVKCLNLEADRVELVSRTSGHFDVLDAWWHLTAKGMNHVRCSIGEVTESGRLQLTGRELRLSG
jgi:hypothetical protein